MNEPTGTLQKPYTNAIMMSPRRRPRGASPPPVENSPSLSERIHALQQAQRSNRSGGKHHSSSKPRPLPTSARKKKEDSKHTFPKKDSSLTQVQWPETSSWAQFPDENDQHMEEKENSTISPRPLHQAYRYSPKEHAKRNESLAIGSGVKSLTNGSEAGGSVLSGTIDQKIDGFLASVSKLAPPNGASKSEAAEFNQIVSIAESSRKVVGSIKSPVFSKHQPRETTSPLVVRNESQARSPIAAAMKSTATSMSPVYKSGEKNTKDNSQVNVQRKTRTVKSPVAKRSFVKTESSPVAGDNIRSADSLRMYETQDDSIQIKETSSTQSSNEVVSSFLNSMWEETYGQGSFVSGVASSSKGSEQRRRPQRQQTHSPLVKNATETQTILSSRQTSGSQIREDFAWSATKSKQQAAKSKRNEEFGEEEERTSNDLSRRQCFLNEEENGVIPRNRTNTYGKDNRRAAFPRYEREAPLEATFDKDPDVSDTSVKRALSPVAQRRLNQRALSPTPTRHQNKKGLKPVSRNEETGVSLDVTSNPYVTSKPGAKLGAFRKVLLSESKDKGRIKDQGVHMPGYDFPSCGSSDRIGCSGSRTTASGRQSERGHLTNHKKTAPRLSETAVRDDLSTMSFEDFAESLKQKAFAEVEKDESAIHELLKSHVSPKEAERKTENVRSGPKATRSRANYDKPGPFISDFGDTFLLPSFEDDVTRSLKKQAFAEVEQDEVAIRELLSPKKSPFDRLTSHISGHEQTRYNSRGGKDLDDSRRQDAGEYRSPSQGGAASSIFESFRNPGATSSKANTQNQDPRWNLFDPPPNERCQMNQASPSLYGQNSGAGHTDSAQCFDRGSSDHCGPKLPETKSNRTTYPKRAQPVDPNPTLVADSSTRHEALSSALYLSNHYQSSQNDQAFQQDTFAQHHAPARSSSPPAPLLQSSSNQAPSNIYPSNSHESHRINQSNSSGSGRLNGRDPPSKNTLPCNPNHGYWQTYSGVKIRGSFDSVTMVNEEGRASNGRQLNSEPAVRDPLGAEMFGSYAAGPAMANFESGHGGEVTKLSQAQVHGEEGPHLAALFSSKTPGLDYADMLSSKDATNSRSSYQQADPFKLQSQYPMASSNQTDNAGSFLNNYTAQFSAPSAPTGGQVGYSDPSETVPSNRDFMIPTPPNFSYGTKAAIQRESPLPHPESDLTMFSDNPRDDFSNAALKDGRGYSTVQHPPPPPPPPPQPTLPSTAQQYAAPYQSQVGDSSQSAGQYPSSSHAAAPMPPRHGKEHRPERMPKSSMYAMRPLLSDDTKEEDEETYDEQTVETLTIDGYTKAGDDDASEAKNCSLICGDFDFRIKGIPWFC